MHRKTCENCWAFHPAGKLGDGFCHRNVPGVMFNSEGDVASAWPPVRDGHWCSRRISKFWGWLFSLLFG